MSDTELQEWLEWLESLADEADTPNLAYHDSSYEF
jgi:hypothetical protein